VVVAAFKENGRRNVQENADGQPEAHEHELFRFVAKPSLDKGTHYGACDKAEQPEQCTVLTQT